MSDLESFRVERTVSVTDTEKFSEAVCSFANDMPGSGLPGYLLVGVTDQGRPSGLKVTDHLLQRLASLASDGTILPSPALSVHKLIMGQSEIAVVEVMPHPAPPVRYRGRVCVRVGPRRGTANEAQEYILAERRTAAAKPFDTQPCRGGALTDLALDLFLATYRGEAIEPAIIEENHRPVEQQMASLRLFDLAAGCPTNAAMLLFAKDPLQWIPHAYLLYVKYEGVSLADAALVEKRFTGDLLTVLRSLDAFVEQLPVRRPVATSALREEMVSDYPVVAVRELLMNAVMHRSYQASSPVRFFQFSDRIEIQSPGPLYGEATTANFPRQTSYRNPVVAEAMKVLGFVNRFGRGVVRAEDALAKNGNPPLEFDFGDTFFGVTIRARR